MKSLWQEQHLPAFPRLEGDVRTDVLIIGGGITGILTAYRLQKSGVPCILVEKGRLCGGNTGHTTAKITSQHGFIYQKLIKDVGTELAQKYLQANENALAQYRELCRGIDCGYTEEDNYVYTTDNPNKAEKEMDALRKIAYPAEFCQELPLPLKTSGAVKFRHQAQFHPLQFLSAIVSGLRIYENTFVREMKETSVVTDRGKIYADKVIAATHFPFINKHGSYFLKLYQHRSYVLALKNAQDVNGMYVDENNAGLSFRNYSDLLLLGGGGHRTGTHGGNWQELRRFAAEHYPEAQEQCYWAAQDCMSLDGIPYIGQYSKNTPDFYVASGFNKWGMTGSMVASMLLNDLILEKQNDYKDLFSPSRSILKPQLLVNGFEAAKGLLTVSPRRCPHLGCALKWNSAEHSWDCSCHGSRFSEDGKVLDNPSNGDLKL